MRACTALLVAPALLLACASVAWSVGGYAGGGLWPAIPATLSEAVATRDKGEAARLIATGEDPNRPARVRAGLLSDDAARLVTPFEAAIAVRRADMAQMLVDYGAQVDGSRLRALRCYSEPFRDAEMHAWLERLAPEPWPDCAQVADAGTFR